MSELHYDLTVLVKMLQVLPAELRRPLLEQYGKIINHILGLLATLEEHNRSAVEVIESAQLEHAYIAFDLEATRRERDKLRQQLERLRDDNSE